MEVDITIIGAGINGCGIASDAAGRGLKVALIDKGDIGSGTSNASTKLIHGGLRYLEHFELSLVKESLHEQTWLKSYGTYLVEPLKFIIPHSPIRPAWQVRAGLYLYDKLANRELPYSKSLDKTTIEKLSLYSQPDKAFSYYDYQTDDHRLTVCEAIDAQSRGAQIFLKHEVVSIKSNMGFWQTKIKASSGSLVSIDSKVLINATGPWVKKFQEQFDLPTEEPINLKLSQGSHLVVKKLYDEACAYLLQEDDKRIIFALPYHGHTLVGTTDLPLENMPNYPMIQKSESEYLINRIRKSLNPVFSEESIIEHYSGVRALLDTNSNASKCSRDYKLISGKSTDGAVLVHVVGGKITTWRSLAENVINKISPLFTFISTPWTTRKILAGARLNTTAKQMTDELCENFPELPTEILTRYAKTYGTRSYQLIGHRRHIHQFGRNFGAGLMEREIEFLVETEWASDFSALMRRTRMNFYLNPEQAKVVQSLFSKNTTFA